MVKLISFVVTAVIMHYNEWLRISSKYLEYTFIRGISFKDCAYNTENPNHIECVKWTHSNNTEWHHFWSKHGIDSENVQTPSIWYANAYYICFLLLVLYVIDMGAMLIMCCRQRQSNDDILYQKQVSLLASLFIGITYISVITAVLHFRTDLITGLKVESSTTVGFGTKLFAVTMAGYFFGVFIQHAYHLYNFRNGYNNVGPWFRNSWRQVRTIWRRPPPSEGRNARQANEVEMEQLKR
ncbi:hypothetical protein M3Y99_01448000 [Aphelenchoides fujianensis]|nr:hypothetical protein M3Y99_01448000 [Aphelenchoides fujianensis]